MKTNFDKCFYHFNYRKEFHISVITMVNKTKP